MFWWCQPKSTVFFSYFSTKSICSSAHRKYLAKALLSSTQVFVELYEKNILIPLLSGILVDPFLEGVDV